MKGLVFLLGLLPTIYASLVHITPASEDDFYNPPAGFESAKNGDILKLRIPLTDLLVSISLLMSRMLGNSWSNLKIPLVTQMLLLLRLLNLIMLIHQKLCLIKLGKMLPTLTVPHPTVLNLVLH